MLSVQFPTPLEVLVVLGSLSDQAVAEQMAPVFTELEISAHFEVCSAHRDPERLAQLVQAAEQAGCQVFVAVAGMAAHLPGVIAARTARPVVGVPTSSSLSGWDALLSIAQMPPGIPVACVAVDAGRNAALLAAEILSVARLDIRERLQGYRTRLREENRAGGEKLRAILKAKPKS